MRVIKLYWNVDEHEFIGVSMPGKNDAIDWADVIKWNVHVAGDQDYTSGDKWHKVNMRDPEFTTAYQNRGYIDEQSHTVKMHIKNPICGVEVDGKIVYCKH